jgi:hypothetical protein
MLAVAHSLLVSIYHMLRDHVPYQDLGPDDFDHLRTHQLERQYVRRLEALGLAVTLALAPASSTVRALWCSPPKASAGWE